MRRVASTLLACLAAATSVVLAGGSADGATVSTARARTEIARLVGTAYPGLPVGNVACPPSAARAAGVRFTCTVQLPGSFLVVDATQDGTTGEVTLSTPQAVLTKPSLEQFVAANASLGAVVDCGPPFVVRRPGQTVTCSAALEDGTRRSVTLSVRDPAGTVVIASVS